MSRSPPGTSLTSPAHRCAAVESCLLLQISAQAPAVGGRVGSAGLACAPGEHLFSVPRAEERWPGWSAVHPSWILMRVDSATSNRPVASPSSLVLRGQLLLKLPAMGRAQTGLEGWGCHKAFQAPGLGDTRCMCMHVSVCMCVHTHTRVWGMAPMCHGGQS